MPFPAAREPPGCREIGSVERVRAPRREPLKSGRNDLIGWGVAERRRKRTTVKRVADGTPQVDIAETRSSRVEDDCVDDRRLVWVVLLLAGACRCACRAGPLVEEPTGVHQRGRVVEVLRKDVEGSPIGEPDCPWC